MRQTQTFNGKIYTKYKNERYFSRGTNRLHRIVWEHTNGKIPKGYHVHHKDENTENNDISNLELKEGFNHLSEHSKSWHKKNPDFAKQNLAKHQDKCQDWHKSEEGRKWHSEHAKKYKFGTFDLGLTNCEECGKEYKKKTTHSKYCHQNCKMRARRRRIRESNKKK